MINDITEKREKIAVIGLGYVGLPLALEFSKKVKVIGFDVNETKVRALQKETKKDIEFTSEIENIKDCICYIVAVPTPVDDNNEPELSSVISASEIVGKCIKEGNYVIYESTVYPGLTEEICIPQLEKYSKLKCGRDFKVGYSPERINPGDIVNTISNITKIVSGCDQESCEEIAQLYSMIIKNGVYKAENIKTAEAAKIIENTQRDINIAFINEMTMLFDKMGISIYDVLKAADTKWNFIPFKPGLVGGHCIGVDPYYLIYKARQYGFNPKFITYGREINEYMSQFIVNKALELLKKQGKDIKHSNVVIMGFCFKENIDDIRNTKIINIIKGLKKQDINVEIVDPLADKEMVKSMYGIEIKEYNDIREFDMLIMAVAHNEFKQITIDKIKEKNPQCIIVDIKNFYDKKEAEIKKIKYWSL